MGEKKMREYMTTEELLAEVIGWSERTLHRKIESEGFPVIRDGNKRYFPRKEVDLWFKKRTAKN